MNKKTQIKDCDIEGHKWAFTNYGMKCRTCEMVLLITAVTDTNEGLGEDFSI